MPVKLIQNKIPEEFHHLFVWDGCQGLPPDAAKKVRSPWHDEEEKKRGRRDFLCNVWRTPIGSAEVVFDINLLDKIKKRFIREPSYKGEVVFDYKSNGKINTETIRFWQNRGLSRFIWWGNLFKNRPIQIHNYIIGCDISAGLGASYSVFWVYDVNTYELLGLWKCSNTKPEQFADLVVAFCYWVGGVNKPFLMWEANGPYGSEFGKRVIWQGYYNVYTQTREDTKTRKRGKKYGWFSNTQNKLDLLAALNVALCEGLKEKINYKAIKFYSQELLDELLDYVFKEKSKDAVQSSRADLSSGALERRGDLVVPAALCILGTKEQKPGEIENMKRPPLNSFAFRMKIFDEEQLKKRKRYIY